MSKIKVMLLVCLVFSLAAILIMIVSAIVRPETANIPTIVSAGIVPAILIFALFRSGDEGGKK
ncbi:MAG: hypothetical protein LBH63_01155 [Clostridiales Family XIII bacterium]|nr:hypothetical protein [Clostridiales Family XIII bacterium]